MFKNLLVSVIFCFAIFINAQSILAVGVGSDCDHNPRLPGDPQVCDTTGYSCQQTENPNRYACQPDNAGAAFGKVQAPSALSGLLKGDQTGAAGISAFLSNLVALIYTMAAIALVFMLVWGAFEWMTSGGNKEQVEKARNRIINAIVAIIILAATFAILDVLGTFTGFKFFSKQGSNPCPPRIIGQPPQGAC